MSKLPSPEALFPYIVKGGAIAGIVAYSQIHAATPQPIEGQTPKSNGAENSKVVPAAITGESMLMASPNLLPVESISQASFSSPFIDRNDQLTQRRATAVSELAVGLNFKGAEVKLFGIDELLKEGYDLSTPDTFANHLIKQCAQSAVQQSRQASRGGGLINFVKSIFEPATAEAASLEATAREKQVFIDCIKAVERKRPFFTTKGYAVESWTVDNVIDQDTIGNWRPRLIGELKSRGLNIAAAQVDKFVGDKIEAVFVQKDGTLAGFTAIILSPQDYKVREASGASMVGYHSTDETVWMVVVGNNVLAVFGKCDNAFLQVLTPPTKITELAFPTPTAMLPTPTETPKPSVPPVAPPVAPPPLVVPPTATATRVQPPPPPPPPPPTQAPTPVPTLRPQLPVPTSVEIHPTIAVPVVATPAGTVAPYEVAPTLVPQKSEPTSVAVNPTIPAPVVAAEQGTPSSAYKDQGFRYNDKTGNQTASGAAASNTEGRAASAQGANPTGGKAESAIPINQPLAPDKSASNDPAKRQAPPPPPPPAPPKQAAPVPPAGSNPMPPSAQVKR